jgi:hypothetical protein
MQDRFTARRDVLVEAVLNTPGALTPEIRMAIYRRAAQPGGAIDTVPALLAEFVDKIEKNAYKIVDADIERLRQSGYDEDALYEAIVTTAAGAGMRRIERGLDCMTATGDAHATGKS